MGCGTDGASQDAKDSPVEVEADTADVPGETLVEPASDATPEASPDAAPDPGAPVLPAEIATEGGKVRGTGEIGWPRAFLGIPFAAPPVGDLRWRAPQPAARWDGVLSADVFGPGCAQDAGLMAEAPSYGEDCLTLNVWSPGRSGSAPVLVFIHGGGFLMGASASSVTIGDRLAADRGLVVVTLNYRLGPLGFLAHPALTAADPAHPTNFGLLDQRAALEWVHRNIAAFGGDPGDVTLAGQSAGGMGVCAQLAAAGGDGLFHRAILQSGPCMEGLPDLAGAEAQGAALAGALGCDGTADVLACLRGKDEVEVRQALPLRKGLFFGEGAFWQPAVDGVFLPGQPALRVRAGDSHRVPLLIGSNGDEGSLLRFLAYPGDIDEATFTAFVGTAFGGQAGAILARYPVASYPSVQKTLDALLGDFVFVCPTRRTMRDVAATGQPVRAYRFLHAPGFLPLPGFGAYHTAELPFVFAAAPAGAWFDADQEDLAGHMSAYWAAFVRTGEPGDGDGTHPWPAYDAADDRHLVLDFAITQATGYEDDACDFWDGMPMRP
jgi:para-nitrobenzyl esterase